MSRPLFSSQMPYVSGLVRKARTQRDALAVSGPSRSPKYRGNWVRGATDWVVYDLTVPASSKSSKLTSADAVPRFTSENEMSFDRGNG